MARTLPQRQLCTGPKTQKFLDAVNATEDPGRDNELVEEFLAADKDPFGLPELKKDREQLPSESPWHILYMEEFVIDLIRLCHWHYLETENPLFVFRAIEFGQHLTTRNIHHMNWTQKYLLSASVSLARLVSRPPAAENAEAAFAKALQFKRDKYKNPFRRAAAIIESDDLYDCTRRLIRMGVNTTQAMRLLGKQRGMSYEKVRAIYYERRELGQTEATRFNSSNVIPLNPPRF
jgi:hypothetical protein